MRTLLFLGLSLAIGTATAADKAPPPSGYRGWQFDWDNDMFGRTDRWFTNALRLSFHYDRPTESGDPLTHELQGLTKWLLSDAVTGKNRNGVGDGLSYTLGQLMYTPADITVATPQRNDRPWAGALYAAVTVFGFQGRHFQSTDLKLGVTGRPSGAGWVQRQWHEVIDADYPAGWEHQLRARPFVQAGHLRLWRWGDGVDAEGKRDRWGFHAGGAVVAGTHRSYASLLAGLSFGLQPGPNPVFAVGNDGDLIIQNFGDSKALRNPLFFAGLSYTAVAQNRFITGDTAAGRSDVTLRRGVAAWQAGASLPIWFARDWRLMYVHTQRSAEFRSGQRLQAPGTQRWGTISLVHEPRP